MWLLQCCVYITFLSLGDVNIQNSKANEANYLLAVLELLDGWNSRIVQKTHGYS